MKRFLLPVLLAFLFTKFCIAQQPGNALSFDGVNDYVSAPLPALFTNLSGSDFTLEVWVKPESVSGSQRIFSAQYTSSQFVSVLLNANLEPYFYVYSGGANSYKVASSLPLSQWTHLAFTWQGSSGQAQIYINGALQSTAGGGSSTSGSNNIMTIGSRSDGTQNFTGEIDELRVWDVARSTCEIQAGMTSEFTVQQQNLLLYYNCNQGTAGGSNTSITTLNDFNSTYDGTLNNFTLSGATSNWVNSGAGITQVNQPGSFIVSILAAICPGDSYVFGSQTLSDQGIYTDSLISMAGCDSVVTLNLIVNTVDTSVTQVNSVTLSANATGAAYQWLDCDNNYNPIPGEIYKSFVATSNGNYAVVVTENTCSDTSACFNINAIGIDELNNQTEIKIFPSVSTGVFYIEYSENKNKYEIEIINVEGKSIKYPESFRSSFIDLTGSESGMYFIIINTGNKTIIQKVLKL